MGSLFNKLFDLFIETSKKLAAYLPQSGEDLIDLFRGIGRLATTMNLWVTDNLGVNLQAALTAFGRVIVLVFNYFFHIVSKLVDKL